MGQLLGQLRLEERGWEVGSCRQEASLHKMAATAPAPSVLGDRFTEKEVSLGAGKIPQKVTTMLSSLSCESQGFRVKFTIIGYTSSEIFPLSLPCKCCHFLSYNQCYDVRHDFEFWNPDWTAPYRIAD